MNLVTKIQPAPAQEPSVRRLKYIDALRVVLTCIVVCHHVAIALGAPGWWYYTPVSPNDLFSQIMLLLFVAVNQAYFMSLFYFIAAYFSRNSLMFKSQTRFVRDRLIRLGVPLIAYSLLINPLCVYLGRLLSGRTEAGFVNFALSHPQISFGMGPLWFVFVLLMFTGIYVTFLNIFGTRPIQKQQRFFKNYEIMVFALVIGAITFLIRTVFPIGTGPFGLQVGYFPLYISLFAIGIHVHRCSSLDLITKKQTDRWFIIAIIFSCLVPIIACLGGAFNGKITRFIGGWNWQAYIYAMWEPFVCIGVIMKLIQTFRDRFINDTPQIVHLAKYTYIVYLLHPIVVILITNLVKQLSIPVLLLFLINSILVLVITFSLAILIRRIPIIKTIVA